MQLIEFLNQPLNQMQHVLLKRIGNSPLNHLLVAKASWKLTFVDQEQVLFNEQPVAFNQFVSQWTDFESKLVKFLKTLKTKLKWDQVEFEVDLISLLASSRFDRGLRINLLGQIKQKQSNYWFDTSFTFDPNESLNDLVVEVFVNYHQNFVKKTERLLAMKHLNLWNLNQAIRLDSSSIVRDHYDEDDWSYHQGLCYDFNTQYLNLISLDQQKEIKTFDNCYNSFNCQILGLIKYVLTNQEGIK